MCPRANGTGTVRARRLRDHLRGIENLETRSMLTGIVGAPDAYGYDTLMIQAFQAGSMIDVDDLKVVDLQTGQIAYQNDFNSGSTSGLTLTFWRDRGVSPVFDATKTRIVNNRLRLETTGFGQNGAGGYDSVARMTLTNQLPTDFEATFTVYKHQWAGHALIAALPNNRTDSPYYWEQQYLGGFATNIQGGQINFVDVTTATGWTHLRSVPGTSGPYLRTDVHYRVVKRGSSFSLYAQDMLLGTTSSLATIFPSPPSDIALTADTVAENAGAGAVVGMLTTTDQDAGDSFLYALVSGDGDTDNALFRIVDGTLLTVGSFDYETSRDFTVRVRSTDAGGLFTEKTFVIAVTDVNEPPTALALIDTISVLPEDTDTTARIKVAGIVVTDDALGKIELVTWGADADRFEIDGGALWLKAGVTLDAGVQHLYAIAVTAFDGSAAGATPLATTYVLEISGVGEPLLAPQLVAPAVFTIVEDTPTPLVFPEPPCSGAPAGKTMTVVASVSAGVLSATAADGIRITGSGRTLKFTGSLATLNDYFTATPGRLVYTPARDATTTSLLTLTLDDTPRVRGAKAATTAELHITPINDAPVMVVPDRFVVRGDRRTVLVWPAGRVGFSDVDSALLTVTLSVPDGDLRASSAEGITVSGTPTAPELTGSPSALSRYFRTPSRITYTPTSDASGSRTLTTTVSDGIESRVIESVIAIRPVSDASRIAAIAAATSPSSTGPADPTPAGQRSRKTGGFRR